MKNKESDEVCREEKVEGMEDKHNDTQERDARWGAEGQMVLITTANNVLIREGEWERKRIGRELKGKKSKFIENFNNTRNAYESNTHSMFPCFMHGPFQVFYKGAITLFCYEIQYL